LITIHLNGQPQQVPEGQNLQQLLEWLKLPGDRLAVELNREIVPRRRWAETPVQAGDRLEVVHFVGGGTCQAL
jgi:thiamine biosynthesis protein ThiS